MASAVPPVDPSSESLGFIASLDRLDFDRGVVAGDYVRFYESARNALKEFRARVLESLAGADRHPSNFLIWGAPGSGKSFLVQQVAAEAGPSVRLVEANLAQLDVDRFRERLAGISVADADLVCFVDEVDAHPGEAWPFELLLPALEPSTQPAHRSVFCLAGSGGADLEEFVQRLAVRPKGPDLLSRIPPSHRFSVPQLQPGDKMLVAAFQLSLAAAAEGRVVHEIERLALYFLVTNPTLSSARHLRAIAVESARRLPAGEDRLRYDHLFAAGDAENKRFWDNHPEARQQLADRFLALAPPRSRPEPARRKPSPAAFGAPPDPGPVRIAILPFANISPDPSDRYLSDGLTEELIAMVSKLPGLRVIARTSVAKYRDGGPSVADAARELGVASVIEGSVRRAGNDLRVTAQLIDAETETPAWSMTFDRKLENVFVIQEELARRIADSLHIRLLGDSAIRLAKVPTRSFAAYEEYLQGRQRYFETTEDGYRDAIAHFERAVALDPSFALAYCGLAEAHAVSGNRGFSPIQQALDRAEVFARHAMQLDSGLAEAHAALGSVLFNRYDWTGAERELDRALVLDPGNVQANFWRAVAVGTLGRPEAGLRNAEKAVELDPLNPRRLVILGQQYYWMRRYDDAVAAYREAGRRGAVHVHGMVAYAQLLAGRPDEAVREAQRGMEDPQAEPLLARIDLAAVLAYAGRKGAAREILAQLAETTRKLPPAGAIAWIEVALGDWDRAFASYARARQEGSMVGVADMAVDPVLDPLRQDPRFSELLRQFNFPVPGSGPSTAPGHEASE
ncbi:MAG: AAA family ATPase [Thermoplasmata archaeon]|nr:AAA family ATPase [Thermoplasmata archaeon]